MRTVQQAAVVLLVGGACVALSAFVPWVSALGIISARLPGYGVAIVLLLGLASGGFGGAGLSGRLPVPLMVLLWVLVGVDVFVLAVLFALIEADTGLTGALVKPAAGFWLAVVGVIAEIGGTIFMQVAVARASTVGRSPVPVGVTERAPAGNEGWSELPLSPDRRFWWDGQQWLPVTSPAPGAVSEPGTVGSANENPWWNGETWIPGAPSPRTDR